MFYSASCAVHLPLDQVQAILDSTLFWDDKNLDSYEMLLQLELEDRIRNELDFLCWANNYEREVDWTKADNLQVDVRADVQYWLSETKMYLVIAAFKIRDIELSPGIWTSDAAERAMSQFWRETTIRFRPMLVKHIDHWDLLGKISRRWDAWKRGMADIKLIQNSEGVLCWKWVKCL